MKTVDLQLNNGYSGSYNLIFPTVLGKFQAEESVWKKVHSHTVNAIYKHKRYIEEAKLINIGERDNQFNAEYNGITSYYGESLTKVPTFNLFTSYLKKSLHTYFSAVCDYPLSDIILYKVWFTVYPKGHHIPRHSHPASQFSGVYYFDVTEDSGDIIFEDPISDFRVWYDDGQNPAGPFRPVPRVKVTPNPGMFLVFPSWLPHHTLQNKSDSDRIIFSFNFTLV